MKKFVKSIAVILSVLLIVTFSACSSRSSASSSVAQYSAENSEEYGDNAKGISASSKANSSNLTPASSASSRKIIKSGNLSLTTTTYDKSVTDLESAVESFGGYIESSTTQGEGASGSRSAVFTVRVPTDNFNEFLDRVGKVGKVVERSVNGKDVTEKYIDTETRLTALKTEHQRLLELLDKATKMSDILEIEQKLSDIERDIDQYTGELKKMDSLVDLSTVNISISEISKDDISQSETFIGKIGNIFNISIDALVITLKYICYCVVAILPFAVVIGLITAIVYLARRKRKKSDDKKPIEHTIINKEDNSNNNDNGGNE